MASKNATAGATGAGAGAAAGTGGAAAAAGAGADNNAGLNPDLENDMLASYLLITLGSISAALIVWRVATEMIKHTRTVACLSNDTQRYFAIASSKVSWLKRNVIYAPILGKRHNREFALSSALNMGTLPTRLQFVLLAGYFATNIGFCVKDIPFDSLSTATNQLRNRTGTLAVANMIPLVIFAGRNNPLLRLLNVSFDTFNLMHRWLGRIVVLEILAHVISYLVGSSQGKDLGTVFASIFKTPYQTWGIVTVIAVLVISVQAMSVARHAFYEVFKLVHITLAVVAIVGIYYHLNLKNLPQIKFLYAVIACWGLDRLARVCRLAWANLGAGGTKTVVEALPGGACRVTVSMARPWHFRPGQHAYLYMPAIGYWQSHPFSVAWSQEAEKLDDEKLPMDRLDVLARKHTTMSFVIRARTGFTSSLYNKAVAQPEGKLTTTCLVEGPYGGRHLMHSYGTVMLFAGGVGITQAVPHVRDLVVGYGNNTLAARKVVLVWIIQSPEHLEWIRPWMTEILAMDKRREILRIMLFVSRPRSTKEIHSPSATVQMFPGRPNIDTLLGMEMEQQVGAMGVSVCGPGNLSDEVRLAVRKRQYQGAIDFVEEAFSW